MNNRTIILHAVPLSGHCNRVEQLLSMLELPYVLSPAPEDVRQSDAFARLNPLRQIPVLQDGDVTLTDSNAILVYLARTYAPDSDWLPQEPAPAVEVQRWFSIAAGEIMHGPAFARMIVQFDVPGHLDHAHRIAGRVLAFMEQHLESRTWLAADHATLADLACHAYVAHAPEGGVSLAPYPAVRGWLARVEALPNFVPMPPSPIPSGT